MNMSGDIRVKTDVRYRNLYNDLKNYAVGDMHELFFICVCIGYRDGKKKALGNTGDDRFWSRTITPEEYACYYAIMLDENSMDLTSIKDDKNVISEMEKYANAGMELLLQDFLGNYLHSASELRISPSDAKDLPKDLLHYIYDQIQ